MKKRKQGESNEPIYSDSATSSLWLFSFNQSHKIYKFIRNLPQSIPSPFPQKPSKTTCQFHQYHSNIIMQSLQSSLKHFHHIRFMFHLLQLLLKLPLTLLHTFPHSRFPLNSMIILKISLLQLPILILQILDLFLHHLDGYILGLQLLLYEDIIDLVTLLYYYQIIICMGQLTDVVLQLDQLLLHVTLVFSEVIFCFFSLLFLLLVVLKQAVEFLIICDFDLGQLVHELQYTFVIGDFLKFFDKLLIRAKFHSSLVYIVAVTGIVLFEIFELFHLKRDLQFQAIDLSLQLVFLVGDLVTFYFERVNLLILDDVKVLLHLELTLKLCQVIGITLLCWECILLVLKIRHCLLFQVHQDVILQLLDVLIPHLQLFFRFVKQSLEFGHGHFLVYFRSVLDLFSRDTETQGRDGLCQVVRMWGACNDQGCLRVASQ